jgi:uncharacterized YigZ family protein
MQDKYLTIKHKSEGIYKEKGSKFIAFAHRINDEQSALGVIEEYRKSYYDARHVCFAWRLGAEGERFRMNDDGEPSGTAGKPIHGQLLSYGVTNVLIVVIRYFGGTKLGVSGLISAYREAASDALKNAEIMEEIITESYTVTFPYTLLNEVMRFIKDEALHIENQTFESDCTLRFSVRISDAERVKNLISGLYGVSLQSE